MRFERPDRRECSTENARFTQMGSLVIFYIFIFVSERAACRVVGNMRKSRKKSIKVYCVCSVYLSWDCLGVSFIIFKWVCVFELQWVTYLYQYRGSELPDRHIESKKWNCCYLLLIFMCSDFSLFFMCRILLLLHSFMINTTYTHKLAEL